MNTNQLFNILGGIMGLCSLWAFFRVWRSTGLKLYFVSRDLAIQDRVVVCANSPHRKRSLYRFFFGKLRDEEIDITLTDYSQRTYTFGVKFHFWRRYSMLVKTLSNSGATLQGKPCDPGQSYKLRSGMLLAVGDRKFEIDVRSSEPRDPDPIMLEAS